MLVKNTRILLVLLSATLVWSSLTVASDTKAKEHAETEDEGTKLETVKERIRSSEISADALGKIFRGWETKMNATKFEKLVKSSGVDEEKAEKLKAAFKAAPSPEVFLQGLGVVFAEQAPAIPSAGPKGQNAKAGDDAKTGKDGKEGKEGAPVDPKQKLVEDAIKRIKDDEAKQDKAAQAQQDRLFSAFRKGDGEERGGDGGPNGKGGGPGGAPPGAFGKGGPGGEGLGGGFPPPPGGDDAGRNIGKALSKLHDDSNKNSKPDNNKPDRGVTINTSSNDSKDSKDKRDRDRDNDKGRDRNSKSDEDSKLASVLKEFDKKDSKAEAAKKEEEAKAAAAAKAAQDKLAATAAESSGTGGMGLNGQPFARQKVSLGKKSSLAEISSPAQGFNPATFNNPSAQSTGPAVGGGAPGPGPAGLGGATMTGAPIVAGAAGYSGSAVDSMKLDGGGMAYNFPGGGYPAFKRIDNIYQGGGSGGGGSSASGNDSDSDSENEYTPEKSVRMIPATAQIYNATPTKSGPTNILMQTLGKQLVTVCRNNDAAKVGVCERVPSQLLKDAGGPGPLLMQGRI